MIPFVPNIGFVELMDSFDQSIVYDPVEMSSNKNKTNSANRKGVLRLFSFGVKGARVKITLNSFPAISLAPPNNSLISPEKV